MAQTKYKSYPSKFNFHDIYIYFMRKERESKKSKLTWENFGEKEFRKICIRFNDLIMEDVFSGKTGRFPHGLGSPRIRAIKVNWDKLKIDYNESKKAGKTVYHTNTHSNGYYCRFVTPRTPVRNDEDDITHKLVFILNNSLRKKMSAIFKEPDGYKKFRKHDIPVRINK